ncbi:uncharacterized protein N7498_001657 [Penicillium cinerascens]|uniref:Uncharacterized protein n=1 Tax=Penicillium cinerascens TaxID=70096 RepID=A0A9W9N8J4_9EURO|nr:uncharacterized protein N7498_001657 [Penicillium cinerascens]KAJ5215250.1 hypothetical protein N7498_001657 [Penicillium cinerascens]
MSFYVSSNQMIEYSKPFSQHHRATVFNGKPQYNEIISEEASGRNIKRLANTHEARGEVLVMVSASHKVRDLSRKIVCKHLEQRVRLYETEFQPS